FPHFWHQFRLIVNLTVERDALKFQILRENVCLAIQQEVMDRYSPEEYQQAKFELFRRVYFAPKQRQDAAEPNPVPGTAAPNPLEASSNGDHYMHFGVVASLMSTLMKYIEHPESKCIYPVH